MIISKTNKIVKLIKSLELKKNRDDENLFVLEGKKFVFDAINQDIKYKYLIYTSENQNLVRDDDRNILVSDDVFKYISSTKTPQGVLGIFHKPSFDEINFDEIKNIVFLDEVRDSINVGSLIRSSVCADFDLVIFSKNSADPYSSKALRASAGSILSTKLLFMNSYEILNTLKEKGFDIIASTLNGSENIEFKREKNVLVVGNEGSGISEECLKYCSIFAKIPMSGRCDSLNAGVSGGILMYKIIGY